MGAAVSAVVKSYAVVPAKPLPATSLIEPPAKVTKYCVLLARSFVGSIVSVDPEIVRRELVAASNVSTTVPVAEP